ncbi:MAG: ribonuclease J [Bacilli bacterium]|nr:ribonuclease J [Bacilli bacterium]
MNDIVKIIPLGGQDEEGKNCYVIEINDDIFVLECGIRDPDKTLPGVDYVIPRFDYLVENKKRIKGYFLTHGHDDVIGGLTYLYDEAPAPVYGSKISLQMLKMFTSHAQRDPNIYDLREVAPTSTFKVAGRNIHFFHTAHNIAGSSGISIETSLGDIVFTSDYVIENAAVPSYLNDMNALARIAERPILALLSESVYASRAGYTAPLYKLTPQIEEAFKTAPGRIFVSLFSYDLYNVNEVIDLCRANKKKLVFYDESVKKTIEIMQSCGEINVPKENFASLEDILRIPDQDTVILMTGFGERLFRKVALLACGENEDRRIRLKPEDTFIMASMSNDNTEIEYKDAADELYRSGCHVLIVNKKKFLRMHASEEDLKMMASLLKPKYYIPEKGLYKDLLANAQLALSMGINLTHYNVFVPSNGDSVVIDENSGRFFPEGVPHGDIMIDGSGVGDVSSFVLEDRQKLAQGVLILSATVSKSKHQLVSKPDIQMKGLLVGKEADMLSRDLEKILLAAIDECLSAAKPDVEALKQSLFDKCTRLIRRITGQEPMVLPLIIELD